MRWLIAIIGCCGLSNVLVAQHSLNLPNLVCGSLTRSEGYVSKFVDARNVDIWLPAHYDPNLKYPVLYMQDGQALFDSTKTWNHQEWGVDDVLCALSVDKQIRDCIVVAIWNNGEKRAAEYFPQKVLDSMSEENSQLLMPRIKGKPLADNYLKFLVLELKPEIDKVLPTLADPANTFIAGSSMGGLISLYAICEYPEVFGAAACLSTHWPGIFTNENNPIPEAILAYLAEKLPSPKNHRIYFDHGTDTLDSLYGVWQSKADILMKKKGFEQGNWMTKVFPGAPHTEEAWRKRLHFPLTFLLKPE